MDKVKWGVLGTGRIANTFAAALRETEGAELFAAASRSIEKAEAFAAEYGFEKAYGSYEELVSDSDVDIVYIATPMASHYHDAMLCLNAGKNVLCEKSVTLNTVQLEELLALAKSRGLFFMEAMWMKCRPFYLRAREWVSSGRIGDVLSVTADFSNHVPYSPGDRLFRPDCGGGALLDLTVYPLTLFADILGGAPVKTVSSADIREGIDFSNSVTLRYPGGAFAKSECGFERQLDNAAAIHGSAGSILFGNCFFCSGEVTLVDGSGRCIDEFSEPEGINGYTYEISEAQGCIREGRLESPLVPHSSTLAVMRIMDECRRQWGLVFPGEDA
ncbi:MAG: Gfo/Idh/MocA family oxidoreductase [Ruminococcus sp.]|nr:Gfo/Idh/MocA family oxidoreductase [Ruminococcus sp.]